jgi:aminopeptidase N
VLTFAISSDEPEDINLFDRDRRLQICTYPSGGRPARYNEDDRRVADVLSHDLAVRFEPESLLLQATHTIRLRLLAPTSTLRLRLHDDFRVSSVTSDDGGSLLFLRVREQGGLVVSLGPNSFREEPFGLTVRYAGRHDPAPIDHELLQWTASSRTFADEAFVDRLPLVYSNRTAWYPRPMNEEFAPVHARFDTPEGWIAVTGGELLSSRTEAGRVRAEYRLKQPGKYVTAVVGRFEDVGLRQEGEQAVRGFATPRARNAVQRQVQTAQEILVFYAGRFGACPYPMLNLAIAEGPTPGGHSPPGLAYLQQRPPILLTHALADDPANFSDLPGFFLAHELAHQWWGQGVAPANPRERWLAEAWAQYAAALWVRHDRGEDAFRSMMDRMARWAVRHDAAGPIHLGPRLGHLMGDPRVFRSVVYDKGAWVLHMLRGLLGDEAFFGGARAFLERHRYAKAGSDDLREALEQTSGRDLKAYFERWIYGTGLPTLLWSSRTETSAGGVRTRVEVRPDGLPGPLPLEIAVYTDDGREVRKVMLDPAGGSWTIDTPRDPRRVELNEDRGLLARLERTRRLPAVPPQR